MRILIARGVGVVVDSLPYVSLQVHAVHIYDQLCVTYSILAQILIRHQELKHTISNHSATLPSNHTHRRILDILQHILIHILNDNLPSRRRIRDRLLRALLAIFVLLMRIHIACTTLRIRRRYLALLLRLQSRCLCFAGFVDLAVAVLLVAVEILDELVDGRNGVVARVVGFGRYGGR